MKTVKKLTLIKTCQIVANISISLLLTWFAWTNITMGIETGTVEVIALFYMAMLINMMLMFIKSRLTNKRKKEQFEAIIVELSVLDCANLQVRLQTGPEYTEEINTLLSNFNRVVDNFHFNWKQTKHELERVKSELNSAISNQSDIIETEKMASLGRLVAGVSHEINTPLGIAVTGMTHLQSQTSKTSQLLESGTISAIDLKRYLIEADKAIELVLSQVYIAADLIKNFKQVAVDQTSPEHRDIQLNDYIEKVVSTLRPEFKKSPYELVTVDFADTRLSTCPGALSQVITILIQNALNHAFEGRGIGFVYVLVQEKTKFIELIVRDDGVGISDSIQAKIFEPFFTTKRGQGGSGLGLSLAYNICKEVLKAKLLYRVNEHGGSDFVVRLKK